MGFAGLMAFDVSELTNANPWTEDAALSTLPVYRNHLRYEENYYPIDVDWEQMEALFLETAGKLGMDTENLRVTKESGWSNYLKGGEDGIALGSEMSGGIEWVFFENNIMRDGVSAVRFKANLDRGATCKHIRVRNMDIANFENFIWFQLNYPGELGGNFPTIYSDLVFEDITVESISGNLFDAHAPKGYPLQGVTLQNVTIKDAANNNLTLENVKDLVLDNVVVGDQVMNGHLSSI